MLYMWLEAANHTLTVEHVAPTVGSKPTGSKVHVHGHIS
jgi:hypothetical protein